MGMSILVLGEYGAISRSPFFQLPLGHYFNAFFFPIQVLKVFSKSGSTQTGVSPTPNAQILAGLCSDQGYPPGICYFLGIDRLSCLEPPRRYL